MNDLWVIAIRLLNYFCQLLGAALGLLLAVGIFAIYYQSPGADCHCQTMLSWKLYQQCKEPRTVTSELARDPSQTPGEVFDTLYDHHHHHFHRTNDGHEDEVAEFEKKDALQRVHACGNWGAAEPSKLFLQVYHDALCSLEKKPISGMVSPPVMGSTGVVPLTIIAPLPDLCRHLANCIARAKHEVFLGTNFWIHSEASTLVTNAIRELSRRAGERGEKIIMKMVYDRGDPRQVMENRLTVPEDQYSGGKVRLPSPKEIPNVDLEVINFHRPVFGTFHSKFTVIDRQIALLQSSNIQDNDNLEMLAHIEGPIVDGFYDSALLSWGKPLAPPLPLLSSPAANAPIPCHANQEMELLTDAVAHDLAEHTTKSEHYDETLQGETERVNNSVSPRGEETPTQAVTRHLNTTIQPETTGDAPESDQQNKMHPYITLPYHEPVPMAMVNREPYGAPNHNSVHTPQNAAWISAINNAQQSIFLQTPNMNAEPLLEPLLNAVRRGISVSCYLCLGYNDAGELLPFQNGTNEMIANRLYNTLETEDEKSRLDVFYYVGKDQTRPIHNSFKKRSCHIKLMIVDEQIAIQGNGNLDTQSFFHSQEINVLIDSRLVCKTWREAIDNNQNTAKYGAASTEDGCWHDPSTGEIPENSIGTDPGHFSWAKGVVGAVKRVRGVGGF
ncbi:uncharacterized protein N7459_003588 [Penicillium hispanicum]|uniref:uncharacterized protein n=1 Tax=Penicillium hispanicum TaxID=1080232 RepID=UPI002540A815|nr:uncharacterized protein N7459_003588 [Penicillium hispanicum]KAJ5587823.1 hypothetical protein N7459_003588 [Penicillium hispanicum]